MATVEDIVQKIARARAKLEQYASGSSLVIATETSRSQLPGSIKQGLCDALFLGLRRWHVLNEAPDVLRELRLSLVHEYIADGPSSTTGLRREVACRNEYRQ